MGINVGRDKRISVGIKTVFYHICLFTSFIFSLQLHKQQSRGELSRHTWHRQESDESSDSVPDEVRSEPSRHSRHFPRSHTFPTSVPSPSAIPTSASAIGSTTLGQEGASSQSNTQRRYSGPAAGPCLFMICPRLNLNLILLFSNSFALHAVT